MKKLAVPVLIGMVFAACGCGSKEEPAEQTVVPKKPDAGQANASNQSVPQQMPTAAKNDKELSINPNGPLAKQGGR